MPPATCLFCTAPVTVGQSPCPALAAAGVAAHRACCGGCAADGYVRSELATSRPPAAHQAVVA